MDLKLKDKALIGYIDDYFNNSITLHELFEKLPSEKERDYELCLGYLIKKDKDIREKAEAVLANKDFSEEILFAAFYCLCTYYRRFKEYRWFSKIITKYKPRFEDHPTFSYLESMLEQEHGDGDLRKAIALSDSAIKAIPDNAGILHSHAVILCEAFEEEALNLKDNSDKLEEAIDVVKKAINLTDDYPKFYCTLGRLLAVKSDFENAKKNIIQAIDMENPTRGDYSIVIGEYQRHISRIEFKRNFKYLELHKEKVEEELNNIKESTQKEFAEMKRAVEGSMNRNLEFLGFFTALISFTIGAIQIAAKNYEHAARLIITLCGGLLLALGGFGIVLNGKRGIYRNTFIILMAIIIIIFALLLPTIFNRFGLDYV